MGKSPKKKDVQGIGRRSYPTQQGDDGGRGGDGIEQVPPVKAEIVKVPGTGVRGDDDDPKHRRSGSR